MANSKNRKAMNYQNKITEEISDLIADSNERVSKFLEKLDESHRRIVRLIDVSKPARSRQCSKK